MNKCLNNKNRYIYIFIVNGIYLRLLIMFYLNCNNCACTKDTIHLLN